ncbi:phosphoribosyltransferase family protein [Pseudonocardia abyssalis]|uniref:phosphoribosyltransferase family protein n=1 Tax=Pseudonocardia abyssalis TaxID=2792008 RepID=UPI001C4A088E|nr:phosphoribosyltransferase family protein [Pseudonocardia abyssalis]
MTLSTSPLTDRIGVHVRAIGPGADPAVLLGLALRRNPRRAQLLVSRVLGKHVPTDPRLVRAAGLLLGGLVADVLAGRDPRPLPVDLLHAAVGGDRSAAITLGLTAGAGRTSVDALVLGYAETATALGHCVAEALTADYLHSTRRPVDGFSAAGGFSEEHSHATDHLLLPADPDLLRGDRPLVLVDDELSTGRTVLNTITALHATHPRARYVVATLVDARPDDTLVDGVAALGARLDVVALCRAEVTVPPDVHERVAEVRAALADPARRPVAPAGSQWGGSTATGSEQSHPTATRGETTRGETTRVVLGGCGWPDGLPVGGRHGFLAEHHRALDAALPALARSLGARPGESTLVLGTEELMALPLRLAQTLADAGCAVRFSTTTRSPAVVVDEPGYALRTGLTFGAHDDPADGPGPRFAYNLGGPGSWDHVVVVVDPSADTPALHDGLLAALAPLTRRTTLVITP